MYHLLKFYDLVKDEGFGDEVMQHRLVVNQLPHSLIVDYMQPYLSVDGRPHKFNIDFLLQFNTNSALKHFNINSTM